MKIRNEVKKIKEAEEKCGRIAAFFDLDGTLLARPSMEWRFFRMLRYRRAIRAKNSFLWLREAVRLARRGIRAMRYANKMYLRGVGADIRGADGLKQAPPFFAEAIDRIAWHAAQEHKIVIVSGTLEPLAREAARELESRLAERGIAASVHVFATRLEEKEGRWTGRIVGEAMFGEAKARAVKRFAAEMGLDLERSYGYGDNANDRLLLAAVGRPVAVNPSRRLALIARKRSWQVVWWKEKRPELTQRAPRAQSSQRRTIEAEARTEQRGVNSQRNENNRRAGTTAAGIME